MTRYLLLFTSVVFSLALIEAAGRIQLARLEVAIHRDVDHRIAPNSEPGINSDGIRSAREAVDFPAASHNIVFLGDSYAYGLYLEPHEALPQQLEAIARRRHPRLDVRIANFGWVSSSPLLSLRLLRDIGAKYRPDVVILAVDMTDIHDDIKYRRLLERYRALRGLDLLPGSVATLRLLIAQVEALDPLHRALFGYPSRRYFATDRPLVESEPLFDDLRENLDRTYRYVRDELHAHFVVLVLPRCFQYSTDESPTNWESDQYEPMGPWVHEPFRWFERLADEVAFPIHSLLPAFQEFRETRGFPTCFANDPHWSVLGTRVAARAAYRACRESGCFE